MDRQQQVPSLATYLDKLDWLWQRFSSLGF